MFSCCFLASAVGKSVASFCIAALVFVAAVVAVAVAVAVEEAFGRLSVVSVAEGWWYLLLRLCYLIRHTLRTVLRYSVSSNRRLLVHWSVCL